MKNLILLTISKVGGQSVTAFTTVLNPAFMGAPVADGTGVRFLYADPTLSEPVEYTAANITLSQLVSQVNAQTVPGKQGIVGVIDFALGHAAQGTYNIKDLNGNDIVIPANSRVHNGYMETVTTFTGASATIALGYTPDGTTTAILGTTTATTLTAGTKTALVPVGTAASATAKTTAARNLILTIATANVTAGKAYVYLEIVSTGA